MTDPTSFRLDTHDLAPEFGWEVDYLSRVDEFSKDGVTILVQYSSDDAITSLTRTRPNRADEVFSADSRGNDERLRVWLTGRAAAGDTPTGRPTTTRGDTPKPGDWTRDEFIQAVDYGIDRAFLLRLLELVDDNNQLPAQGTHTRLYFGTRPGGAMFVYPFGRRHPPFKFSIKGGRLMISGCWTGFPRVKGHSGFADLAMMLDLDERGSATAVPVTGLDADDVWEVGERVSRAINA